MTAVTGVNQSVDLTALASAQQASAKTTAGGDAQNRFLTLLVTQLKNQDPLNPMDNAQLTTQLAQISTVEGIDKLNVTLQSLAASFALTQSLQATGMIGHDALVPGSTLALASGKAVAGIELAQPADKVIVTISDADGNVRERVDLGPRPAGVSAFEWDGDTPQGAAANG
ncbi:MAG TPA: flagellar hook capping FlgD N-terminal domain-containing protein, partial [Burkholderiales bacterium]|nr:flagellar hook capping FlgD N-terminal domain-containing protein [Burkholderiales bacterium]